MGIDISQWRQAIGRMTSGRQKPIREQQQQAPEQEPPQSEPPEPEPPNDGYRGAGTSHLVIGYDFERPLTCLYKHV